MDFTNLLTNTNRVSLEQAVTFGNTVTQANYFTAPLSLLESALNGAVHEAVAGYFESVFQQFQKVLEREIWLPDEIEQLRQLFISDLFEEPVNRNRLLAQAYHQSARQLFPEFYQECIAPFVYKALTDKSKVGHVYAWLAESGHARFLQNPVVVRIMEPAKLGVSRKGRAPEVPQYNACCFVYNPIAVKEQTTGQALVSLDGTHLEKIPLKHARVKVLTPSNAKKCCRTGIYIHNNIRLPVLGLRPAWQQIVTHGTRLHSRLTGILGRGGVDTTLFDLAVSRFLADRLSPKQFWNELCSYPDFAKYLNDESTLQDIQQLRTHTQRGLEILTTVDY